MPLLVQISLVNQSQGWPGLPAFGRVILQKLSNVTKRQEARMPTWASAGNDHSGRNSLVVHSKCFKSLAHQGNRFIERAVQPRIRHKSNAHAE